MRVAWLTDIHLDHAGGTAIDALAREVAAREVDGVVLTGDLSVAAALGPHLGRLVEPWDVPAWLVLGNHDYWGSDVASVRRAMRAVREIEPRIRWLPHEGVVSLTDEVALVGVDGWADARHGDVAGSPIRLRDYRLVEDLVHDEIDDAIAAVRALADADAAHLRALLDEALATHGRVIVATHVPPFPEAARFEGSVTHPHWLPWVTCKAVGDVLLDAAARHPDRALTVLCGHMHHPARVRMAPNLEVRCGAATYREPALQDVIEV